MRKNDESKSLLEWENQNYGINSDVISIGKKDNRIHDQGSIGFMDFRVMDFGDMPSNMGTMSGFLSNYNHSYMQIANWNKESIMPVIKESSVDDCCKDLPKLDNLSSYDWDHHEINHQNIKFWQNNLEEIKKKIYGELSEANTNKEVTTGTNSTTKPNPEIKSLSNLKPQEPNFLIKDG